MPQSLASVYLHIVFGTKNRVPLISPDLRKRLYPYIVATDIGRNTKVLGIGGVEDHVHLLVSFGREVTIADTVKTIKVASSRWIHDAFPNLRDFGWQNGYGVFSIAYPDLDDLRAYFARQEEHHRTTTFQDEYRALLRRHGQDWDERYVWD